MDRERTLLTLLSLLSEWKIKHRMKEGVKLEYWNAEVGMSLAKVRQHGHAVSNTRKT